MTADPVAAALAVLAASLREDPMRQAVLLGEPAEALYTHWYLGGAASAEPQYQGPPLPALFRAAHSDSTVFDPGWLVLDQDGFGNLVVGRGQERRALLPGDYVNPERPAVPPAPGEQVIAVRRIDRLDDSGWWGTRSAVGEPEGPLGRYYLHPRLAGIGRIVAAVTAGLGRLEVRWSLKLPSWPAGFARPDAMVVYFRRASSAAVEPVLLELLAGHGDAFDPALPPLTRRISKGLAYADDPGPDSSYGMQVCAALAGAASDLAKGLPRSGAEALAAGLSAAGLDPDRPWRLP